jgi:hypothetical protein
MMKQFFLFFFIGIISTAHAQNVGIGTSSPAMPLHISDASDTALLELENRTALNAGINTGLYFKTGSYFTGAIKTIGNSNNLSRMAFYTYAVLNRNSLKERLTIQDDGNVGIGTIAPTATLDVVGTLRLQGNGAAAGKVLTSDATGNATWNGSVAFSAQGGYQFPLTNNANTVILYNQEIFDDGNNYYAPAAAFTAPVNGNYHFDAGCRLQTGAAESTAEFFIAVNGVSKVSMDPATGQMQISATLKLNAGDVVDVRYFQNGPNGSSTVANVPLQNYFSGFLIR